MSGISTFSTRRSLSTGLVALVLLASAAVSAAPPAEDRMRLGGSGGLGTNPVSLQLVVPDGPLAPGSQTSVEVHFEVADQAYVNRELTAVTLTGSEGLM